MPEIKLTGATLHYDERGNGPEAVVFAHGVLWSGAIFAAQVAALQERYRCIAFDFRGHGLSETTSSGYDLDTLTEDVAGLIEGLACGPCHFVGHSMGGFVGLRLAIRRPELLRSLALIDSSAEAEPPETVRRYRLLNFVARHIGLGLVAGEVMPIMFGRRFLADPARRHERREWRLRLVSNDRHGVTRAVQAVVDRTAVSEFLSRIRVPTLIVAGGDDTAIVPAKSEALHAGIPRSRLVVLPGVGHTATVEAPQEVNRALVEFLSECGAGGDGDRRPDPARKES